MRRISIIVVFFTFSCAMKSPPKPQTRSEAVTTQAHQPVREVARILTGEFSSQAQSEADPDYYSIRLIHRPIWLHREDGPWLYVEQSVSARPDSPYRQRVYQLIQTADAGVESRVYTLPDPDRFVGAEADAFRDLKPADLQFRVGCSIRLKRHTETHYSGQTQGKGCATTLQGAQYATSEVDLQFDRLTTWDRGFREDGTQAWGAVKGPYRFDRVE